MRPNVPLSYLEELLFGEDDDATEEIWVAHLKKLDRN
jgi:hypothetical protein